MPHVSQWLDPILLLRWAVCQARPGFMTRIGGCTYLTWGPSHRYGFHATLNSYFLSRDKATTDAVFAQLRHGQNATSSSSMSLPTTLAGLSVLTIRDLTSPGYDSTNAPTFAPLLPVTPAGDGYMISFTLQSDNDASVTSITGTVRTSGTEPKVTSAKTLLLRKSS